MDSVSKFKGKSMDRFESESPDERESDIDRKSMRAISNLRNGVGGSTSPMSIVVTGTYTVDPIAEPLKFWLQELDIAAEVQVPSSWQPIQQLLNPMSEVSLNRSGINLLLIRMEDWDLTGRAEGDVPGAIQSLMARINEFASALEGVLARTSASFLVFCAPMSDAFASRYGNAAIELLKLLLQRLATSPRIKSVTHDELMKLYPVEKYEDPVSGRLANIPYTDEYFAALATWTARHVSLLSKPRSKVIVVDCDNTLWHGVCGEQGPSGVVVTREHHVFQRFLLKQYEAGVLLCICSKNSPADVWNTFKSAQGMTLKEEHFIASRINWHRKSENLRSLATELDLSLDSFIFIDDSHIECEEVRSSCPAVLVLDYDNSPHEVDRLVNHTWEFDRPPVTDEARRRTVQYRENRARAAALATAPDYSEFVSSLQLCVDVRRAGMEDLRRVSELVQRTTQFNLMSRKRRYGEIEAALKTEQLQCLVVNVQDRFGDYGLVGVVLFAKRDREVEVDTFLLSCRALGRHVEYRIVNALGEKARELGADYVSLLYRETSRNRPAREFLYAGFAQFATSVSDGSDVEIAFRIPVKVACEAIAAEEGTSANEKTADPNGSRDEFRTVRRLHKRIWSLSSACDVVREVRKARKLTRTLASVYIPPQTDTEALLVKVWQDYLQVESVGVGDNFFDLGGDSLSAVRIMARMESLLGVELDFGTFLECATIDQVVQNLRPGLRPLSRLTSDDTADEFPLSAAQRRIWFIEKMGGTGGAYHISVALRLRGSLDSNAVQMALDTLLQRHEILRSIFVIGSSGPIRRRGVATTFDLIKVQLRPDSDYSTLLQQYRLAQTPFDLERGPLIRGLLIKFRDDEHVLLLIVHHIVADGWSVNILISDFADGYGFVKGEGSGLLDPPVAQYADFVQWQHDRAHAEMAQLEFWKSHLSNAPELIDLPLDYSRPPSASYRGGNVSFELDEHTCAALRQAARLHNSSVFALLFSTWAFILGRLSNQKRVVIGVPVANRRRLEFEGIVGLFVNTLAVCVEIPDDSTASNFLISTQKILHAAFANQDIDFERVVELLRPHRSVSRSPVFQIQFAMQPPSVASKWIAGISITEETVPLEASQFDITLAMKEAGSRFMGSVNFATDLFESQTIERWASYFVNVVRQISSSFYVSLDHLKWIDDEQRRQILCSFNDTQMCHASPMLIHQLFESQVVQTPDAQALICDGNSMSYSDLNKRCNQLAAFLAHRGVDREELVGVCLDRGFEMVISLFAVLKAGGAYVPLDPNYPPERLKEMLRDSSPRVILTQRKYLAVFHDLAVEPVPLDSNWQDVAVYSEGNYDEAEKQTADSRSLAYVIYTSGSTGKPKGAMNEHRAVVNRLQWMQHKYRLDGSDRVLQKTPFSFDVSVWEFFWTLMTGATLIIARPRGHQDPAYMSDLIERSRVTRVHFVPSMLRIFLDQMRPTQCRSLTQIICSGEELPADLRDKCLSQLPWVRLTNLYGPTEAAVDVTSWECHYREVASRVPIGTPISNTMMYVLDRFMEPSPIGVPGEIYIGGVGVGRGYLNRAQLTAERFVCDPFLADGEARLYKTGDIGRWRKDGALEYLGRNDHQVKIRGLRIELGEIEHQLKAHCCIANAVAIVREDAPVGEKAIVAYITPKAGAQVSVGEIRAHLKSLLPEYMVPNAIIALDTFPLTPNGKLDRQSLPRPDGRACVTHDYEAPQGPLEAMVARLWENLLHIQRVGRQDNFFELGGHSLLIIQFLGMLRREGWSADIRSIFEKPTLAGTASVLVTASADLSLVPPNGIPTGCEHISPEMLPLIELSREQITLIASRVEGGVRNIQDIYPLAPLQEGLLFHHLNSATGDPYIVPMLLALRSRAQVDQLAVALQVVINRHDVLRTAFLWTDLPSPVQVVLRRADLNVEVCELAGSRDPLEQLREWSLPERQSMNLQHAPLIRLRTAGDASRDRWYALLQIHHIIGDYVSQLNVISEVAACMQGRSNELPAALPYRNHVARALHYARSGAAENFFTKKLGDLTESTLMFGNANVHDAVRDPEFANRTLDSNVVTRVRQCARDMGIAVASIFHCAWSLVVSRASGRDDVVFGTVLSGRMQGFDSAGTAMGMFINTLPLRLRTAGVSVKDLMELTHSELTALLDHELASLVSARKCSRVDGEAPLFNSLINFRRSVLDPHESWIRQGIELIETRDNTNYPIVISIDDRGEEGLSLEAQTDGRVAAERINQLLVASLCSVLNALVASPRQPASMLNILPRSEIDRVLLEFNATRRSLNKNRLVHQHIEENARISPNRLSVVHGHHCLTYAQLNEKADKLAARLRNAGVGPDDRVAVYLERSPAFVISLIAALKAGGAFLPIDTTYPSERVHFILKDARPALIISSVKYRSALERSNCAILAVEESEEEPQGQIITCDYESSVCPWNLAYVIYTSGSTGTPKGVMVEHRNLLNLVGWHREQFNIQASSRTTCLASVGFDAIVWEIFPTLAAGGALILAPVNVSTDLDGFLNWWRSESFDVSFLPTPIAEFAFTHGISNSSVRTLLVGGDRLRHWPGKATFRLVNNYGPTESTVVATSGTLESEGGELHIGRPVTNTQVYILDPWLNPVLEGVAGELFIGGDSIARGYLEQQKMTAESFLPDPFSSAGRRMYRTGDLGRWRADGTIEFLGRRDDQIKIRGFRIELKEIEAALRGDPSVEDAFVMTYEDSLEDKRLVAYIVLKPPAEHAPSYRERIRDRLKLTLPDYMIPGSIVGIPNIPLTAHGKVDKHLLPAPEIDSGSRLEDLEPNGVVEKALATVWRRILSVDRVGRNDSFFRLGGHSILALRAIMEINAELKTNLRVLDLYKHPTLAEFARLAQGAEESDEYIRLSNETPGTAFSVASRRMSTPLKETRSRAVLFTGATGFVGRFLLSHLMETSDSTVTCLVRVERGVDPRSRLIDVMKYWGLWREDFGDRLVAIPGDLRAPGLGLNQVAHRSIIESVDTIYHCATSMNHLETYMSAKAANVDSAKEIIAIADQGRPKLINYISTLGVFSRATSDRRRVVDECTSTAGEKHRSSQGYTASKWVAENMIMEAQSRGVPSNIFRLGLVWADSIGGRFDRYQQVYRVLKSSLLMGCGISDFQYFIPPTPVDFVAKAILTLATRYKSGGGVFHISCSRQMDESVFNCINRYLTKPLRLVPLYDWIKLLQRQHEHGCTLPAVPLFEYAFSLDEASFHRQQRVESSIEIQFSSVRTEEELKCCGLIAPMLDDELIGLCLKDMFSRDEDIRQRVASGLFERPIEVATRRSHAAAKMT